MTQTIIALAGRKQAGKNTSFNCMKMWRPEVQEFAFADSLKRMCIDILGLTERQAYGTDEDKNTLVEHLLWENFPVPAWTRDDGKIFIDCDPYQGKGFHEFVDLENRVLKPWSDKEIEHRHVVWQKTGPMTARQVLQYWGTEIFRRAYGNVWADACIRKIRNSGCEFAVITDCRFPNELETVQAAGGKVIKLTRCLFPEDRHPSETAFDEDVFDQNRFDYVLDNREMDVSEQCESLYAVLRRWGCVGTKQVVRMHV